MQIGGPVVYRPIQSTVCSISRSKIIGFDGADDGIRTHTPRSRERILSPLRLPFRHIGAS
jgi:hypothetical protein